MKKICLLGPVDKRAISYPLIKCLTFLGKALVITDDGVYRRFADDFGVEFGVGVVDFIVTPIIDDSFLSSLGTKINIYDIVVYITTNEIPSDCDKIVYCHGVNKSICSDALIRGLEEDSYIDVIITLTKLKGSKALKIEPNKEVMRYILDCEDNKDFMVCKNSAFATMLHKFFGDELELPKETIKGLLERKE